MGYLERFIDLQFHVPRMNQREIAKFLFEKDQVEKYIELKNYDQDTKIEKICEHIILIISKFLEIYNPSFREAEKIIKRIKFLYSSTEYCHDDNIFLSTFFLLLKIADREVYKIFLTDTDARNRFYRGDIVETASRFSRVFQELKFLENIRILIMEKKDIEIEINANQNEKREFYGLIRKHFEG